MMIRNIFGIDCDPSTARVHVLPVPYDATTSYRPGAARGPLAVLSASDQVDLCDADVGSPHEAGVHMHEPLAEVESRNQKARAASARVRIALDEGKEPEPRDVALVNSLGESNNQDVYAWTQGILASSGLPVILGGDHSVPFGSIRAVSEHYSDGVGLLHFDAHADLRDRYQGFEDSHASIFNNVIAKLPKVTRLTQVGIRDFSHEELDLIKGSNGRILTYFDRHLRDARFAGTFPKLAQSIVSTLPQNVYVSFDIDGLDPVLCPNTGTPVPGGLSFDEMIIIMATLANSGRTIVGLDLCEVAPPRDMPDDELSELWDANVGARVLYKLIGFALMSRGEKCATPPALPTPPGA
jgi:agmatinase